MQKATDGGLDLVGVGHGKNVPVSDSDGKRKFFFSGQRYKIEALV